MTNGTTLPGPQRIAALDGFRGLAILLVVLYHAYVRWPDRMPYGDAYANVFPFGLGGLWLFFILSGFFIPGALERSKGFARALYKRWLRLFPAMLIASVLILATGPLLPERPLGVPELKNAVPGLVFLDPHFIERVTGADLGMLEGAFWSLFVDMKFFVLFGIAYFAMGPLRAGYAIMALFLAWCACLPFFAPGHPLLRLFEAFSIPLFGWFVCGVFAHRFHRDGNRFDLTVAGVLGTLSSISLYEDPGKCAVFMLLFAAFLGALRPGPIARVASWRPLAFVASISYPLFLIHEQALVALTIKLGRYGHGIPGFLLPVLPIALLALVAWVIVRVLEPRARWVIDRMVRTAWGALPRSVRGNPFRKGVHGPARRIGDPTSPELHQPRIPSSNGKETRTSCDRVPS